MAINKIREMQDDITRQDRLQDNLPIETVVRYLKKERDSYKAKLEKLIPYAHSLENENKSLRGTIQKHEKEIAKLSSEISKTSMYKSLQEKYCAVKRDNKILLQKLGSYLRNENKDI